MLGKTSFRAVTAVVIATCAAVVITYSNACSSKAPVLYDSGPPPGDGGTNDGTPNNDGGNNGDGAVAAACNPAGMYGAATAVPGIAAGDKMFGAVTPDELTIAWVKPDGTVMYADRTDASQPFGAAQTLGVYEHDRVALSSDGLKLIGVMPGAKKLGQVTRAARGQAFSGAPDTAPFAQLLVTAMNGESDATPPGSLGDPVLSADGSQLFFSIFGIQTLGTIAISEFTGATWSKPATLGQDEFLAADPLRRRPTGLSADGLTLFFWDEIDGKEKAGWRATSTAYDLMFSGFVDLGDRKDCQATAKCSRLYFTNPAAAPSDVKLADKK
jgi:hypothetical protein